MTIPAGDVKAVYSDGAGSGAAIVDAFASLNVVDLKVEDDLTVTDDASVGGDLLVSGEVQTANIGFTDGDNAITISDGGGTSFAQALTANAGVVVDNITIDGQEIDVSSGDLTLDVAGDIILDAAGSDFQFNIGGTNLLNISNASLSTEILQQQSNTDIKFKGNDGGSTITALTLDMSEAGTAVFNNKVGVSNVSSPNANLHVGSDNATGDTTNPAIQIGGTSTYRMGMYSSAEGAVIENKNGDDGIQFRVKTAGEAMRVDGGTGRVGIGETSPDELLTVGGDIKIKSTNRLHFTNTSDQTSIHAPASNTMAFTTNSSERIRIDSSGNVLVGTTTFNNLSTEAGVLASNNVVMARGSLADHQDACAVLQYASDATWLRSYGDTSGSGYMIFRAGGGAGATDVEYMRINSTGEVHITSGGSAISPTIKHSGGTGDVSKLRLINRSGQSSNKGGALELGGITDDGVSRSDVFGAVAGLKTNATSANREGYLQFSTSSGSALSERTRIDSSGNFMHNTTSASTLFTIQGNSTADVLTVLSGSNANANVGVVVFRDGSAEFCGQITCNGSTNSVSYTTSSDARLKNVLGEAKGLEIINQLNPIHFEWKKSGIEQDGLIAQEVEPIVPNAVLYNKESDVYQLDYSKLVTPLVKAVQELYEQVDALQSEIKTLKGE